MSCTSRLPKSFDPFHQPAMKQRATASPARSGNGTIPALRMLRPLSSFHPRTNLTGAPKPNQRTSAKAAFGTGSVVNLLTAFLKTILPMSLLMMQI